MTTVWKYPLNNYSVIQTIQLPAGALILSVNVQQDTICLWAEVDPNAPDEPRQIAIYGTGHEIKETRTKFINTFFVKNAAYVFHAFEIL